MASSSSTGHSRQASLTQTAKSLLRNVIRHTDTHNRLREESETWQQFYKIQGKNSSVQENGERQRNSRSSPRRSSPGSNDRKERSKRSPDERGDLDIQRSFLYDEREDMNSGRYRGTRHAHMDDNGPTRNRSTFWMRQLQKAEDGDPERWGHSGFKEMYPKTFDSDRSRSRSSSESDTQRKRSKHRKTKKRKKEKKKKKKRKRHASSSREDSAENDDERKKKRSDGKKKKRIKIKSEPVSDNDNDRKDNDYESFDNSSDSGGRRSWRDRGESDRKRLHEPASESPHRKKRKR